MGEMRSNVYNTRPKNAPSVSAHHHRMEMSATPDCHRAASERALLARSNLNLLTYIYLNDQNSGYTYICEVSAERNSQFRSTQQSDQSGLCVD